MESRDLGASWSRGFRDFEDNDDDDKSVDDGGDRRWIRKISRIIPCVSSQASTALYTQALCERRRVLFIFIFCFFHFFF